MKSVTNNDKKQKKIGWKDISLEQFELIQDILQIEDETDKVMELVRIIFGDEALDLPLNEFKHLSAQLSFLLEKIPEVSLKKTYIINGKEYILDADLTKMTASQYVDYTNLSKDGHFNKLLAVFLIPKGHKYNEGYDIEEVFKDVMQLSIVDANSIAFIFKRQLMAFITLFQHYSIQDIKKMKLEKSLETEMIERIKYQTILTESCLIS